MRLKIVAGDGCSTVWDDLFESDEAALAEALSAIKDEGIKSFFEGASVSPVMGFDLALVLGVDQAQSLPKYSRNRRFHSGIFVRQFCTVLIRNLEKRYNVLKNKQK